MITALVSLLLGSVGGYAVGRGQKIAGEADRKRELAELREKLERLALPSGQVPSPLPLEPYREPDTSAVINIPVDADDFAQLSEAMCACLAALHEEAAEDAPVGPEALRDCLLDAVYPDFQWPPVPGDPSGAHLMWLVADYEARKTLADPEACKVTGAIQATLAEQPTQQAEFVPTEGGGGG